MNTTGIMVYNLPEGDFTMKELENLYHIAHFVREKDFFCFMNDLSLAKLKRFFKNFGSSGIYSDIFPITNNCGFDRIDKVTYGNVNFWLVGVFTWDHPAVYKEYLNSISMVTKDNLEEFIAKINIQTGTALNSTFRSS